MTASCRGLREERIRDETLSARDLSKKGHSALVQLWGKNRDQSGEDATLSPQLHYMQRSIASSPLGAGMHAVLDLLIRGAGTSAAHINPRQSSRHCTKHGTLHGAP
jgi:hypothetical protein